MQCARHYHIMGLPSTRHHMISKSRPPRMRYIIACVGIGRGGYLMLPRASDLSRERGVRFSFKEKCKSCITI
jgi:hypothetical protein